MRTIIATIVALAALAGCKRPPDEAEEQEAPPVKVTCVPPFPAAGGASVVVRGVVAPPPDRQAMIAAAIPGRLTELKVREGDRVARGDVLAVIEDPALAAAQGESDAQVATARAADQAAAAGAVRAQRLFDEGILARRELEDATARAAAAAAELRAAGARRALAEAQRGRARLQAPFAGTVVRVLRHAGELVDGTAGTAVLELADPSQLELRASAPAGDMVRLTEGQIARVQLDAVAEPLAGKVVAVAPGVDPATALGWVRVALEPPAPEAGVHLRLGLAGQATIGTGAVAGGLAVPVAAVRRGAEGAAEVLVCDHDKDDDVAKVHEVTLGARSGGLIRVLTGLEPGDRVIIDHVLNLADGARIVTASEGK